MISRKIPIALLLSGTVFLLGIYQCKPSPPEGAKQSSSEQVAYLNLHDTVGYVGLETCENCHSGVHDSYTQTGMGQSLGQADSTKSIAQLQGHQILYDSLRDLGYRPYWQNNSLYLEEFRLQNGDTSYSRREKIDYVIGSGQHTNSHLILRNGYLTQAPFTWYSQEQRLDWPPGFEKGNNSRFQRPIGLECMSCHNAMPEAFVPGSSHKFTAVPEGIDCERCHGPGEAHVQKIQAGNITDTGAQIDPSIVNPSKLPSELQFELCQRCHLQGNSVLKSGESFLDFRPGMELNEVMEVYLPRYSNREDKFIMASHVDRFKKSACFQESANSFNCITCHNPHKSVDITPSAHFNAKCQSCHQEAPRHDCTAPIDSLKAAQFNCVECHMPSSTATDIPHVTVHDHYIRKPEPSKAQKLAESEFLGLYAVNNASPSARSKTLAYLQHYERFSGGEAYLLDSARHFLTKVRPSHPDRIFLKVYILYLEEKYDQLVRYVQRKGAMAILDSLDEESLDNRDAWTAYRIGQAWGAQQEYGIAQEFYQKAVELAPLVVDFRNKLAGALVRQKQWPSAAQHYDSILMEKNWHKEALSNRGYLYLRQGNYQQADSLLQRCTSLHPDYLMAWLNQARSALRQDKQTQALQALEEVLRIEPDHQAAQQLVNRLKSSS